MITTFLALVATDPYAAARDASDKLDLCVFAKVDQFARAKEAVDTTVDAALAACLSERAALRTALQQSIAKSSPTLDETHAAQVEQRTYDISITSVHDRALVRLMTARANNAPN